MLKIVLVESVYKKRDTGAAPVTIGDETYLCTCDVKPFNSNAD